MKVLIQVALILGGLAFLFVSMTFAYHADFKNAYGWSLGATLCLFQSIIFRGKP